MKAWRVLAAIPACLVTAVMVSFPHLGPASKSGPPMDLGAGESPARIQFGKMLAAFNSGDRDLIERYRELDVSPFWPHAPSTDMALGWFKQTGGYRVLRIQDIAPNYLVALLRNADSDDLFLMGVEVERHQPHRLIYLTLNYASNVPSEYWPKRISDEAVIDELRNQLASRVPAGKFSGAVLVKRGDELLFREAFGFADRESHTPNTVDTRFRIGRLSNMFTAVALLRLMQEGKLGHDDALGKWLPELMGDAAGRVRIGDLLSNSGGTDDIEHLGWKSDTLQRRSLAELVDEFGDSDLIGIPGRQFRYSSLGFVLLAAVVERVSGRDYADYVDEAVFRPAGMRATDFSGEANGQGRARPYRRPAGTPTWARVPGLLCCHGAPTIDAFSTVDDVARFLEALEQRRLLDDTHTRLMLEPRALMWGRAYHAFGVAVELYEDTPWLTYEDGTEGQNSGFMFKPETGHLVVVLGNFDAPTATQVLRFVSARTPAPEKPFEMNIALR